MVPPDVDVPGAPAPSEPERQDERRKDLARATVLLVEDEPPIREGLEEMLVLWGYEVLAVGSAEEAEFAVRRRRPDAAIVDVFLPGKSGVSLLSRLRERFPSAVLIGTSALSDAAMSRQCKGIGADIFLGKPIALDRLAEALKSAHVSWH